MYKKILTLSFVTILFTSNLLFANSMKVTTAAGDSKGNSAIVTVPIRSTYVIWPKLVIDFATFLTIGGVNLSMFVFQQFHDTTMLKSDKYKTVTKAWGMGAWKITSLIVAAGTTATALKFIYGVGNYIHALVRPTDAKFIGNSDD